MADNWLDKRIVTVNLLGEDFLDSVNIGQAARVHGTVEIGA